MSTFKKITIEEQKALSTDDQREYLKALMVSEGAEIPDDDGTFIVPSGGADPEDSPGALPPRNREVTPPPGLQTEDENKDLPSSMRGELGSLDDDDPVIPAVTKDTEGTGGEPPVKPEPEPVEVAPEADDLDPDAKEEPPKEKEPEPEPAPFMQVNEQTTYKTEEEARKGFDEKDRTIKLRDEELRIAKQDADLAVREAESLRLRMERETAAAEVVEPVVDTPKELPPEPTAQQLYDIYDDPEKGPLEAFKQMMPHVLQDLQPLIDMAQRLHAINADEFIKQLQLMKTGDVMQNYHEESIYGAIDNEYPEFEGKWRDPADPIGKEYARIWNEIDEGYVKIHGASLTNISERSPESVQWAIAEVLSRMTVPSDNGVTTQPPATTEHPAAPPDPSHTDGPEGEPERRLTQSEAQQLAKETAEIAVKAVNERNALHGKTATESSQAKATQPADTKKVWTKEEIRKNPTGFAAFAKGNPNYNRVTLDALPQVRE